MVLKYVFQLTAMMGTFVLATNASAVHVNILQLSVMTEFLARSIPVTPPQGVLSLLIMGGAVTAMFVHRIFAP